MYLVVKFLYLEFYYKILDSSDQDQGEHKGSKLTIFPIPLSLREIKSNISINTSINTKPSKEEIINQAFKFHLH